LRTLHHSKKHSYYQGAPIPFPIIRERMYGKTVRCTGHPDSSAAEDERE
jgi:hypothetical protein